MIYNGTAAILIAAYTVLAVWAGLVARRNRRLAREDWPLTAFIAAVALIWAVWYVYLLIGHPQAGGAMQILNRTMHAPTVALFAVSLAWRGR